jgi:GNAT superfamily N-acetyltransferase
MNAVRIVDVDPGDDAGLARFRSLDAAGPGGAPALPPGDARLVVGLRDGEAVARATARTAEALAGAPGRTGLIGHYEARDAEAGTRVLRECRDGLLAGSVDRIVGPMDGTTWDRYRLALPTPGSTEPAPFLTEPTNPPGYAAHFEAAGFRVYESRLVEDLAALDDRTAAVEERVAGRGIVLGGLDVDAFDETLEELHALSLRAFADNPYYSPIGLDRFRALYRPMAPHLDPDLVRIARVDGQALGLVLAFPDLLDPAGHPTRVVVKTLAVAPELRSLGLGSLLVHDVHRRAARKGFRSAIHALMHVANDSLKISRHGGAVLRRYALYGWAP